MRSTRLSLSDLMTCAWPANGIWIGPRKIVVVNVPSTAGLPRSGAKPNTPGCTTGGVGRAGVVVAGGGAGVVVAGGGAGVVVAGGGVGVVVAGGVTTTITGAVGVSDGGGTSMAWRGGEGRFGTLW